MNMNDHATLDVMTLLAEAIHVSSPQRAATCLHELIRKRKAGYELRDAGLFIISFCVLLFSHEPSSGGPSGGDFRGKINYYGGAIVNRTKYC